MVFNPAVLKAAIDAQAMGVGMPSAPPMDPDSVVRPGEMAPPSPEAAMMPPTPAPQAAPGVAPQAPQERPSLLKRVLSGTANAGTKVNEFLNPTPVGVRGLLSEEEIKAARPNLFQTLVGRPDAPSSRDRFASNLQQALAAKDEGRMREAREAIANKFPAPPGETGQQAIDRLKNMYADYAAAGDFPMMTKVGEVLKSIGGEGTRPRLLEVDAGDRIELRDPYSGALIDTIGKPQDSEGGLTLPQRLAQRQREFQMENTLAQGFNGATSRYAIVADQLNVMKAAGGPALTGDPAAQIAMIFSFMKVLDPTSVVREGEQAMAANARGVPEEIRNTYNQLMKGSKLSKDQVQRFLDQGIAQQKGYESKLQNYLDFYTRRAEQWGVDPSRAVINYFKDPEAARMIGRPLVNGEPAPTIPTVPEPNYGAYFTP
jgi:hypothetical protein